jgi:ferric-dicitrate binding protein FerR (iron transport regulator)
MTKELLIKFINNRFTEDELNEVVRWLDKDALNSESRAWGLQEWKADLEDKDLPEDEKFRSLLDKIHHQINIHHHRLPDNRARLYPVLTWLTRIAAVLLIPVLIALLYTWQHRSFFPTGFSDLRTDSAEIVAPVGSRTVVRLSDGSEVFLNHGSKLKYPVQFSKGCREVVLSGEGYFDVAHDPEKVFIVKAGGLNIKALGTAFNVTAYSDEDVIGATLVEGKITIDQIDKKGESATIRSLTPGQHLSYNTKTGRIRSSSGDIEKYIAWKDGTLVFKRDTMVEVTNRLARWYNVEFEFGDEKVKEFTYTVTFVNETLLQILDLMKIATPIDYTIIPRKKLADGTFSKQKIRITTAFSH